MDKKISQLGSASALQGNEDFPIVQSNTTKKTNIHSVKNYIVPTDLTVLKDTTVNLSDYPNAFLVKLSWSGDTGNMTLIYQVLQVVQIELYALQVILHLQQTHEFILRLLVVMN